MFGYSREHEREADEIGYRRLIAAGYAPRETIRTFEHLQADIKEPFFFASHPRLQERIDSFSELVKDASNGELARERFIETTAQLRLVSLQADLAAYRYKQIILVLANPERQRDYPPEAAYYLGEAYRLRNETGDQDAAEREFSRVIETVPSYAPAHRALGLLYYKRGDTARAATLLRQYLALAPGAADRAYVEYYLTLMETQHPADNDQRAPH